MTLARPCDGCRNRSFLYVATCERCIARMIARTPAGMIGHVWAKQKARFQTVAEIDRMRNLVREERKADAT
jgi:hypothetical protein